MFRKLTLGIMATALLLGVSTAVQARITDPANDILATYTGVQGGDLDVLSSEVIYDGTGFNLTATFNGDIRTTPGAFYVWGFNRGGATNAPFASIGADQVIFNSVVVLRSDLAGPVGGAVNLIGATPSSTPLAPGTATINGSTISARIDANLLPSTGLAPSQYTWNLWPRVGAGNNNQISDFAPNNSNVGVVAVPEAGSASLLAPTLIAALGIFVIRRRNPKVA
ncbi:MAG: hypothetical protein H7145_13070 [Akkermansiaceae bacterium]|nr:hypothetical protein [Armatimonadota bacterium]